MDTPETNRTQLEEGTKRANYSGDLSSHCDRHSRSPPSWHSDCSLCSQLMCSSTSLEMVALTVCGTFPKRKPSDSTASRIVHRLVSIALFVVSSSMVAVDLPRSASAAVYQCLDDAGRTVLSNTQSKLHDCQVLSHDPAPLSLPPDAGTTPQDANVPGSELLPSPPYAPFTPPDRPADVPDVPAGSTPPDRVAPSPPSQPRPCVPGLNPLNPLNGPPCAGSDPSAATPPGAAPIAPR